MPPPAKCRSGRPPTLAPFPTATGFDRRARLSCVERESHESRKGVARSDGILKKVTRESHGRTEVAWTSYGSRAVAWKSQESRIRVAHSHGSRKKVARELHGRTEVARKSHGSLTVALKSHGSRTGVSRKSHEKSLSGRIALASQSCRSCNHKHSK